MEFIDRENLEAKITRKETATVNGQKYDVVKLGEYLKELNPQPDIQLIDLSDKWLLKAVEPGQTYWETDSKEILGPDDFISTFRKQKLSNPDLSTDDFLENLKTTHLDWKEHIISLQMAKDNLDNPIWMTKNTDNEDFPFDGMHRLTRAYMEDLDSIQAIYWTEFPDDAIVDKQ